ncbi:MAG TPA: radical SAM family heme chaperone HemW [Luteibaculaceae bacterium]|nr:radical SAM family heme chaperone HemW [Luteibaculaceae bacterium]
MAGIYIHIPFCKKACNYCDFHFSTQLNQKTDLIQALTKEIEQRASYLQEMPVDTIYFGGGTPSLLEVGELETLLNALKKNFTWSEMPEVTLEANPDDLKDVAKWTALRRLGFNRLSIGIQSFFDDHLVWMNRAHSASEAQLAVELARQAGFENLTIDLIYGIPGMTEEQWKENIQKAIDLKVQHISAYCLTVEERTALHKQVREGRVKEASDEQVEWQVNTLCSMLEQAQFERYEISNFAQSGYESKHNSSYWKGDWYLGIGPSAHSFNGNSRNWNVSNNAVYVQAVQKNEGYSDFEEIDETTAYNEFVMTRLRTRWGIDLNEVKQRFLIDIESDFEEELGYLQEDEEAVLANGTLTLTHKGMFFADAIAASLFLEKE